LRSLDAVRICIVYDCLYPYTIGGAERWYRNVAERLVADGHEVTYATLRQWAPGTKLDLDERVRVVTVGPRMALYTNARRRVLPPVVFGAGVFLHLLRHGRRYDVVHTASFPYFSLLAAAALRAVCGYRLVVDWHEAWSRSYWRDYLGRAGGAVGFFIQRLCMRIPQRAFCFSRLYARRLREGGLRGEAIVLPGQYTGPFDSPSAGGAEPLVVFAGRLIPEKRAGLAVAAFAAAAQRIEGLRGEFYGDGPTRSDLLEAIERHGVGDSLRAPGFTGAEEIDAALRGAMCMLSTSRREGYGLIVVEAAARATPSIVIAGEDNAATELVQDGVNGFVVERSEPDAIADAIVRVWELDLPLRESTANWFEAHARELSLEQSLRTVLATYAG
jgi:glycosyltransferase involved in cell wall biosynthesis